MNDITPKIKQAYKHGNSTVITLTNFIEEGKFYKIEKLDNKIILSEVKIP